MKKLLMATVILFLFAASIVLIQTSCSKIEAQTSGNPTQLGKIIYTNFSNEVWIANYDGSNPTQVNIAFPADVTLTTTLPRFSIKISPDGQKLFFSGINDATSESGIYSCDINGSNVQTVLTSTGSAQPILCDVY